MQCELQSIDALILAIEDWNKLALLLIDRGTAPLLYRKLPHLKNAKLIPPQAQELLRKGYYKTVSRNARIYEELLRSLPPSPLKGEREKESANLHEVFNTETVHNTQEEHPLGRGAEDFWERFEAKCIQYKFADTVFRYLCMVRHHYGAPQSNTEAHLLHLKQLNNPINILRYVKGVVFPGKAFMVEKYLNQFIMHNAQCIIKEKEENQFIMHRSALPLGSAKNAQCIIKEKEESQTSTNTTTRENIKKNYALCIINYALNIGGCGIHIGGGLPCGRL